MKIAIDIIRKLQKKIALDNQEAFEELYRLFFPRLFNFAMSHLQKKEIAEEIVNDIMIKMWNRRQDIEHIENLETYLFVSVRNACLNHLEKYSRLYVSIESFSQKPELIDINNPSNSLEWKEISHKLNLAIDKMPEQCRTVFKLIKEEGFKYKEVAEILGISPRTVETQLFRAIKKLYAVIAEFTDRPDSKTDHKNKLISLLFMLSLSILY